MENQNATNQNPQNFQFVDPGAPTQFGPNTTGGDPIRQAADAVSAPQQNGPRGVEGVYQNVTNVVERAPSQQVGNKQLPPATGFRPQLAPASNEPKRSSFKSQTQRYAGKVTLSDKETYYIKPLSQEARDFWEGTSERAAVRLGLTLDEYLAIDAFTSPYEQRVNREVRQEMWERVIKDALIAWTHRDEQGAPVPCIEEWQKDLHEDIKFDLAEFIISFSVAGESEERFHQRHRS